MHPILRVPLRVCDQRRTTGKFSALRWRVIPLIARKARVSFSVPESVKVSSGPLKLQRLAAIDGKRWPMPILMSTPAEIWFFRIFGDTPRPASFREQ